MKDLLIKFAAEGGQSIGSDIHLDTGISDHAGGELQESVGTILSAIIGVLGFVCVVVMIIGGVNYMTSSGDAGKVKKAKDTILYGLIGLIVAALAFAIVQFLVNVILSGE